MNARIERLLPGDGRMEAASTSAVWFHGAQSKSVCSEGVRTPVTYSLTRERRDSSEEYYRDVAFFTDRVLAEAEVSLMPLVGPFKEYLQENQLESLRSDEEYVLELLTLGMLWMTYAPHIKRFSPLVSHLFYALITLRQRGGWLKPTVDAIRGILATIFLLPAKLPEGVFLAYNAKNFTRLLDWLSATGEFEEEVKRFGNWRPFFEGLSTREQTEFLQAAHSFARWFVSRRREGAWQVSL